ncbi:uncharacterized protein [Coffea arabica]|uniref:Uncharacterized protein LOC113715125 isoform X1 n=1 Tax=Coffea arabica TaxID=13443 RepID=A0A6P6UX48_COFAR|nr:uncharacterized protein LOC113715125 isoform X1 [Coffea arabica]XP_027095105.1 uncharacterized protein LOC113715125 isoform X1 [Coffea arabica]XP_027095106.1 uncharacterized protein LOC113715125 isoform X1 [Coffea arabica]
MLRKSPTPPLLTSDSTACGIFFSSLDSTSVVANNPYIAVNFPNNVLPNVIRRPWKFVPPSRKWELHSTAQTKSTVLSDEEKKSWDACRQALSTFEFTVEEEDKILGKAFGHIHSPYWSEERKMEVPRFDVVSEILSYLRSLNLADDDLSKLLKKFPEVLGCSLEDELKNNVKVLENEWGIEGKTLKNLLMRNPRVLGYNVDCKGDCMAKCTRCWVRF